MSWRMTSIMQYLEHLQFGLRVAVPQYPPIFSVR